jgi:hypothetical protein
MALCAPALANAPALSASAVPALSASAVPATGTHEVILTIPSFGRYAIAVRSAQGVALQLVDRMAGPGNVQGAPGGSDGRIDAFLERGTYKIRLIADAHGSGTATLAVSPFTELQPSPVQLVENKPVLAQLGDHQQRSWWLVVPSQGSYNFEAGGRYLTDLRLWKDGSWIIDAAPNVSETAADPERPLSLMQLSATLEPGLYRLTAYGGSGLPWAASATDAPFMLRWGVPQLSDASRTEHVASLLGIDRFIVPGTAQLVRLALDHPETASVFVQPFSDNASMFDQSKADESDVAKTSRDPVAVVSPQGGGPNQSYLVTVSVKPGEKYRLEVLNQQENGGWSYSADGVLAPNSSTVNLQGNAETLLAVTLPGDPDDEIDTGFILVDNAASRQVVASSVIDLDTALPWRRRFNLLNPVQTYLFTSKNVNLQIDGAGVNAEFVVNRFRIYQPPNVVVPLPEPSGGVWTLTPGFYALTALPLANGRGILTMSMFAQGSPPPKKDSPRLPAAFFPDLDLDPVNGDTLYSSMMSGEGYGLRQLTLPATLDQPLSFELGAARTLSFQIAVDEPSELTAADESGKPLAFALDGIASAGPEAVKPGLYQFSITGPGPGIAEVTVSATPARLLSATPLPPIPRDEAAPPKLPLLAPGQPDYVDLAQGESMTFDVPVSQDALYRFETTGLIETGGTIRTRTIPSLMSVEGNGIGRNFLLQPFLREGEYQLTVTAQGQTAGHAGVAVTETPPADEGDLAPNQPARLTLEPGQAALYHFHVPTKAVYHIFTLGLGHTFDMRLEDADGWPLFTPGGPADAVMQFEPGDYRMILLPGTVENRAVTELVPILAPVTYQGHGPFAAVFGQNMQNRWMEPAPGQKRQPDMWDFTLPAAAGTDISLDGGMRGVLTQAGSANPLARLSGSWTGKLPAGIYVLSAMSAVPDNRVDYDLDIDTTELLPGQSRDVAAPATVPVSLGGGQVEISSFGDQDVRAVLFDAAGREVAENDDRDNDWNFLITGNFPAGEYALEVDPVGTDNAETEVSISAPAVVNDKALVPGVAKVFADGLVHVMPVPAVPQGELLLAGVTAAVPVGLALEANEGGAWDEVTSTSGIDPYIAMPAGPAGRAYRLRAWAEDHGATPLSVTVEGVSATAAGIGGRLDLQTAELGGRPIEFRHLGVPVPELLEIAGAGDGLQWSSEAGVPAAHDPSGTILAAGKNLWLVDAQPQTLRLQPADLLHAAVRLTLQGAAKVALPLPSPQPGTLAIWTVQAQGGQPGVGVNEAGDPTEVMAVGPKTGLFSSAVAFQSPDVSAPVLNLWQAGTPAGALLLTLRRIAVPFHGTMQLQIGRNEGTLPGMTAVQAGLAQGWNRLTLNLPAGMVAVLVNGDEPESMLLGNGAAPDVLETQADTLVLLNPSGVAAPYSVSMQPEAGPGLVLQPGGLLTQFSATAAVLHLAVPGGPVMPLRMAGAVTGLMTVGADGMVHEGNGAVAGPGSQVLVNVQPGLVVVAQDRSNVTNQLMQIVPLPGSVTLNGEDDYLFLKAGDARLVHFETDAPVIVRDGNLPEVFPAGACLNLFQPKGAGLALEVLPVSGSLSGTARFDAVGSIPIKDGLGPLFLVGPGESKLFTFSLDAARSIGVGVRGSVDDASVRLMASDGTVLGTGVIAMHSLPAGTYYLAADVPADGAASVVQPALVGLTLPDDGPPPDVQESYREMGQ